MVWAFVRGRERPVKSLDLHATPSFWSENGYVEMVPPSARDDAPETLPRVTIWLHLPAGGQLTLTETSSAERPLLRYPDGTNIARVETRRGNITGVCGMHLMPRGEQRLFMLQPASRTNHSSLRGYSWPRDDLAAQSRAQEQIATDSVQPTTDGLPHSGNPSPCSHCHAPNAPNAPAEPSNATSAPRADAAGVFTIQRVLSALPASDAAPSKATCDSRRYLSAHLTPAARLAFHDALDICTHERQ